jgi:hypothetical protein
VRKHRTEDTERNSGDVSACRHVAEDRYHRGAEDGTIPEPNGTNPTRNADTPTRFSQTSVSSASSVRCLPPTSLLEIGNPPRHADTPTRHNADTFPPFGA